MRSRLTSRIPQIESELGRSIDRAVEKAAHRIEDEAKARAPVATGELRASIETRHTGVLEYTVSAGAFYAGMVEWGTSHSPPHPFMTPAVEAVRGEAREILRGVVGDL